jgi:hypothetical protein
MLVYICYRIWSCKMYCSLERMLLNYLWFGQLQTNHWLDLSLWVQTLWKRVCFGWCPYCKWIGPTRSTQTMTQGYNVRFSYFECKHPIFLTLLLCSKSCVRPGHVMVFLIVFSVLVCPEWSKYSWYQDRILYCLSHWLGKIDFVCNEVGLNPFLLILVPWQLLVLWRSRQYASGLFIWYYWC